MARTTITILNNIGESGHPCLFPDLRVNAFSFSPLSMMLAVGLSYMAFIMLRYAHFLESFYHKRVLHFVKRFLCIYGENHMVFIL